MNWNTTQKIKNKMALVYLVTEKLAAAVIQLKIVSDEKQMTYHVSTWQKKLLNFSHPSSKKVSSNSEFNYSQECSSWQAVNVFPIVVAYCFLTLTSCRQKKELLSSHLL